MSDIEQKALALLNEVACDDTRYSHINRRYHAQEALCRAIEQHEAFRQEVSDAVVEYYGEEYVSPWFAQFIIPKPKPDPLREIAEAWGLHNTVAKSWVEDLRAALDAVGFEIREKGND